MEVAEEIEKYISDASGGELLLDMFKVCERKEHRFKSWQTVIVGQGAKDFNHSAKQGSTRIRILVAGGL